MLIKYWQLNWFVWGYEATGFSSQVLCGIPMRQYGPFCIYDFI